MLFRELTEIAFGYCTLYESSLSILFAMYGWNAFADFPSIASSMAM